MVVWVQVPSCLPTLGPVAQRSEQRTHNALVLGSNPSRPTRLTMKTPLWKLPKGERIAVQGRIAALKSHIEDRQNSLNWALNIVKNHQHELDILRQRLAKIENEHA